MVVRLQIFARRDGRIPCRFAVLRWWTVQGEDAPFFNVSNIDQWQTSARVLNAPLFTNGGDNPLGANVLDVRLSSNIFGPGNGLVRFDNISVWLVPEPGTLIMLGSAGGLAAYGLRQRRKS